MARVASEINLTAVVVGATGVGKTTIVRSWAREKIPSQHEPTAGKVTYDLRFKGMKGIVLSVYDLGGDISDDDAKACLSAADAVVLVYDLTRRADTVAVLNDVWMPRIQSTMGSKGVFVFIANRGVYKHGPDAIWTMSEEEVSLYHRLPLINTYAVQLVSELEQLQVPTDIARQKLFESAFINYCSRQPNPSKALRPFPPRYELIKSLDEFPAESRCTRCVNYISSCICKPQTTSPTE